MNFHAVISAKAGLPELGQGIQHFRHGRICLWHEIFLDSRAYSAEVSALADPLKAESLLATKAGSDRE
ncbi:MAG: hypothetical protein HYV36_08080 [Lentisphaerae bacterium]|nr:hypothetical protein [Lentisphaerota bacterium]